MVKKVLISGGLGNLGAWVTEWLVRAGYAVTTLSRTNRNILEDLAFERLFINVEDEAALTSLFATRTWDVVIHLASLNDGNDATYGKAALMVNSLGTRHLLQAITDSKLPLPHFIYFSTFHVYGAASGNIHEDTPPNPKSDYASTHLFAEYYVKQFHYRTALPFTIFRLTNSYGCPKDRFTDKWSLALNEMALMAVKEKLITLKGNGKALRDFVWMGDVCDVVDKTIRTGATNEIYNLGSGETMTVGEMADGVSQSYKRQYGIAVEVKRNLQDLSAWAEPLNVSIAKLQAYINYRPTNQTEKEALALFALVKT